MKIIGLTGGTGSGKSTAARRFEEHGIPVVDADRIGHELLAPGGAGMQPVLDAFGDGILTSGIIDRAKLGALVFNDPARLEQLNGLVHPLLFAEIARRIQQCAAQDNPAVVIDAALLGERGEKEPWLDALILVSAPEEVRVQRLVQGRDTPQDVAWQRVRAQSDPERKRAYSTWVVDNGGSLEHLLAQVDAIAEELRGTRGTG